MLHRLRPNERQHYDRWLNTLSGGDARLRGLLDISLGRIAAETLRGILGRRGDGRGMKLGDLPASKPVPEVAEIITAWLTDAIAHDDDWLRDTDATGAPLRLAACDTYDDLLDAADAAYRARSWPLPTPQHRARKSLAAEGSSESQTLEMKLTR